MPFLDANTFCIFRSVALYFYLNFITDLSILYTTIDDVKPEKEDGLRNADAGAENDGDMRLDLNYHTIYDSDSIFHALDGLFISLVIYAIYDIFRRDFFGGDNVLSEILVPKLKFIRFMFVPYLVKFLICWLITIYWTGLLFFDCFFMDTQRIHLRLGRHLYLLLLFKLISFTTLANQMLYVLKNIIKLEHAVWEVMQYRRQNARATLHVVYFV